jgi:Ni,Fe-hydrogenase maturation factor
MNILIFGNPLLPNDNLPIRLIPDLQNLFPNHNFIHIDPSENIEEYGINLTIIDTIQDINKIKIITLKTHEDFQKIVLPKSLSMHDFDLSINLKLLKKLNKIDSVKIIGVPMEAEQEYALKHIAKIIRKL